MKNLAIFGRRHSGKTTAAGLFETLGWQRLALADPLKDMLLTLPGITEEHVRGEKKEEPLELYGCAARRMMQTLGTEWRNTIHPDLWLRLWEVKAFGLDPTLRRVIGGMICDDGRFPHEFEFFKELGVITIGIFRDETDGATDEASEHASEAFPFKREHFDFVLENNGTLKELQAAVGALAQACR